MREIKFRAWDKEVHEMLTGAGILPPASSVTYSRGWKYDEYDESNHYPMVRPPNDRFELMQYTGVKDSNGKQIYEGDITREVLERKGKDPLIFVEQVVWSERAGQWSLLGERGQENVLLWRRMSSVLRSSATSTPTRSCSRRRAASDGSSNANPRPAPSQR